MSSCVALECYSLQFVDMFANKAKLWSDASGLEFRFKHPRFLFIYFVALVTTIRRISYAFISDTNKPANSWWYSHLANDVEASYFARVMRLSARKIADVCGREIFAWKALYRFSSVSFLLLKNDNGFDEKRVMKTLWVRVDLDVTTTT